MLARVSRVSVVIPCYDQARFLGEAIASALAQTRPADEILVVDDGSRDDAAAVAARHPGVRYLRQANAGTACARNRGAAASTGTHLVFLDADDRLLPGALACALAAFAAHPASALVFGRCRLIAPDGAMLAHEQTPWHADDLYGALLRECRVWHPAAAMFRRAVLEQVGGFDTRLAACSDYDLYLRIARRAPIRGHDHLVSEYRQHAANKSLDYASTLGTTLTILRAQRPFTRAAPAAERARREGARRAREYYCRLAWHQLRRGARTGAFLRAGTAAQRALRDAGLLLRHGPGLAPRVLTRKLLRAAGAPCLGGTTSDR